MRRIFITTLVLSMMLVGQALASRVTHVDLSYQNGATVARIHVDGPIRFTHATEIPKEGRPDRVIVDVLTATHDMGAKEFHNLPPCVVTAVRSSQYSVKPEQIVRIVFDLTEAAVYGVDIDHGAITLTFDDKKAKPFAVWSSNGVATPAPAPAVTPSKSVASAPAPAPTVAQKNQAIEKDRQASLSGSSKPVAEPTAAKTPAKKVAVKPQTPAPAAKAAPHSAFGSYSDARPQTVPVAPELEPEPARPSPALAAAPSPKVTKAEPTQTVKPQAKPAEAKQPAACPTAHQKTEAEKPVATPKPPQASPAKSGDKPAPSPLPTPAAKTTLAMMPAPDVKAAPDTKRETPPAAKKQVTPAKEQQVASAPKAQAEKPVVKKETTPVKETAPAPAKPELASKDAGKGTMNTSKTATSRFRRQATSAKIKGTMIAEFPQRLVVKYESKGQRDPFASLVDNTRYSNNPIETRIPNIEGLKLVGIIASGEQANRALFEDNSGYSYMLKSGDKVRNGYVLRVEVDQVFFQIFEYGWSRTVALKMD